MVSKAPSKLPSKTSSKPPLESRASFTRETKGGTTHWSGAGEPQRGSSCGASTRRSLGASDVGASEQSMYCRGTLRGGTSKYQA